MMQESLVFAGFGGQGIMFIGQLLAYAGMDEGYHVTWIPSYGPEMRGGTANCFVVISDSPIGSPLVSQPDVAAVFNIPSFDRFEPQVKAGGLLIANGSLVPQVSARTDIDALSVPATETANALNAAQLTNMVMLGALLTVRPILPLDAIRRALEGHIPAHRQHMLTLNYTALDRGAQHAGVLAR